MLLICDYCSINSNQIWKIPSSSFYIENNSLIVKEDYVNLCYSCLVQKEKER